MTNIGDIINEMAKATHELSEKSLEQVQEVSKRQTKVIGDPFALVKDVQDPATVEPTPAPA